MASDKPTEILLFEVAKLAKPEKEEKTGQSIE